MSLSKAARRGIAIFHKIQTGPSRFVYLLSQTKIKELKEKANGIIRAEREADAEAGSAPNADAAGKVQHDLHDGYVDDICRTPNAEEVAPPADPGIGPQIPDGNE